jgi:hypothetical protein
MNTVIFMHLHRTGGTTFIKLLDRFYDKKETYAIDGRRFQDSLKELIALPEEQRRKYRLVKGHLFWGLHRHLPHRATYLTFMRHPLARAVSQYHFHLQPRCFYPIPPDMTLREFLESGKFVSTDNGMTRLVAGKNWDEVPYGECTREMLELAISNLRHSFLAVGITERFDESLQLFNRLLGWGQDPLYQSLNVNRKKPVRSVLSKEDEDALRHYNRFDLQLYEFARAWFEKRIGQEGPDFQTDMERFRRSLGNSPRQ